MCGPTRYNKYTKAFDLFFAKTFRYNLQNLPGMWLLTLLLMLTPAQTGRNLLRLRTTEIEDNLPKHKYSKDNVHLDKQIDAAEGNIPNLLFPPLNDEDTRPELPGTFSPSLGELREVTITLPTILPDTERGSGTWNNGNRDPK